MEMTSEVFVMILFLIGIPFFYFLLRDSHLPEYRFFLTGYLFLTLSNIFTVVEAFCLEDLFNTAEHSSIALAASMMLVAVIRMTRRRAPRGDAHKAEDVGGILK